MNLYYKKNPVKNEMNKLSRLFENGKICTKNKTNHLAMATIVMCSKMEKCKCDFFVLVTLLWTTVVAQRRRRRRRRRRRQEEKGRQGQLVEGKAIV
jgi:hypothetical protein